MRAKCAMYGCKNASYNQIGYMLNYHRFPKDPERSMVWRDLCKNPRIMKIKYTSLFVCGIHFDKSCFMNQILKPTAVPTKNLPEKPIGLFSMSQENSKESNSATEFDNHIKIELSIDSDNLEDEERSEEVFIKEEKTHSTSEEDESDSNKQLDGSDEESNSSTPASSSGKTRPPPTAKSETLGSPAPRITSVTSQATTPRGSSTNEIIDDSSTFAEFVKTKMREFDPVQRTIAQKLISDVMFLAGTRQLQFGTAVLNPVVKGPQITIDRTVPITTVPQAVAQPRLPVDNGAKKSGTFSAYVIDGDSDDDAPLAKKSSNNI